MRAHAKLLPYVCAAIVVLALFWIWTRFAELWLPSVALYAGVVLLLAGLLSCLWPLAVFGIPSRKAGAAVALGGLAVAAAALAWPTAGGMRRASGQTALDRAMPVYSWSERHEVRVAGTLDAVERAARDVTFTDIRGLGLIMSIRQGRKVRVAPVPFLKSITAPGGGFTLLADSGGEFVAGMAGKPWDSGRQPQLPDRPAFDAYQGPEGVKIAMNLRVAPDGPGWARVSTETRVLALDPASGARFERYWRAVYPGSALIRVAWLGAIERRLQRTRQ